MKKTVINVKSNHNACFAWSVVAVLYPAERNAERESSYFHYTIVLNFKDIEFPVIVNQIKKFEFTNNISINVYSIDKENIYSIRLSERKRDKIRQFVENNIRHFSWIKNLSKLVNIYLLAIQQI